MCDTQVLIAGGAVWFAKNSDREPSEPQPVVRYPASEDDAPLLRVSHIEIPQVRRRRATILSQPAWCWGAEMGVNDAGVAVGNEAIFSRRVQKTPALLGMDLVRLGLERGGSAVEALATITELLETHGQGGPAGYENRGFCYDNSFLIADASEAWVLETAGRSWAARRVEQAEAISNALTLGSDYSRCSADLVAERPPFARGFDGRLMPRLARAHARRRHTLDNLRAIAAPGWEALARQLRLHAGGAGTARRSNADPCMHAAGFVRRHQTTGSMIARLAPDGLRVLFTGTSAPCLSIFRPAAFDGEWSVLTEDFERIDAPLWRRHEWLHRWALGDAALRERLRVTRDEVERQLFALLDHADPGALQRADRLAAAWHKVLWESLSGLPPPRLPRHWRRIAARDGIDPTRRSA